MNERIVITGAAIFLATWAIIAAVAQAIACGVRP